MNLNLKAADARHATAHSTLIQGDWRWNPEIENGFSDASGQGNTLIPTGHPTLITDAHYFNDAVLLDGATQWLSTAQPVLQTEDSYSIAAWVRLDRAALHGKLALNAGEHALTAVSQEASTHSAFYLGLRQIDETHADGVVSTSLRWNFTVAPIDGSETGPVEWQHAYAQTPLDDAILDQWVMLVGVCNASERTAHLYVPSMNEERTIHMPDELTPLRADGGFQIGRGRWLGRNVDQWPGSIGPVKAFSGVLTAQDAKALYLDAL